VSRAGAPNSPFEPTPEKRRLNGTTLGVNMGSAKRLAGVCHNIAHHAVSALSCIHPHLRNACSAVGLNALEIDVLERDPCPQQFQECDPLRLFLRTLHETFERILASEGFGLEDLDQAVLRFEFPGTLPDSYCSTCVVRIRTKTGKTFHKAVDYFGNEAEVVPNKGFPADAEKRRG
jgi:hypothetical protein